MKTEIHCPNCDKIVTKCIGNDTYDNSYTMVCDFCNTEFKYYGGS